MRILDLATEFLPNNGDLEESLLKIVESSNKHYIKDALWKRQLMKVQMKTLLVSLDEDGFCTKGSLSNVVCSLFVQYFASGNYGFVKILNWNDLIDQEIESTRELLKEAISILNKYVQQSGHKRCNEIFSVLTKNHRLKLAGKHGWSQQSKCLYSAGFRLIDTKASSISSDICLLVYKPDLIPNFQVEDGVVGDYVETSAILNICEDLISSLSVSEEGRQEAQCIQSFMKTVNESSTLMLNVVQSSFPWNGSILVHLHFSKFMFRRQHGGVVTSHLCSNHCLITSWGCSCYKPNFYASAILLNTKEDGLLLLKWGVFDWLYIQENEY